MPPDLRTVDYLQLNSLILIWGKDISLHHVQTSSQHPVFCPIGITDVFFTYKVV